MAEEILLRLAVRCDRHAPGIARSAIERLAPLGPAAGDAMLVASELVTNAVLHADCGADDLLHVDVARAARHLVISVRGPGRSGRSATVSAFPAGAFGGLALAIVNQLARRWGAKRGNGHTVWAELQLPSRDVNGPSDEAPAPGPACGPIRGRESL
jgi:hypothetical protein